MATDATGEAPAAGVLLARARERMGLSVGEVANHLKLSIRQVEALEADAFERLPSPMFIRGFARSYSRLLQVDPAPVMQALDRRFPPPPAGVVAPAGVAAGLVRQPVPSAIPFPSADRPSRRLHSAAGLLAAVVVGFLAFEFFGPATVPQGTLQGVVRDPATEVVQSGVPREQPPAAGAAGEGAVGTDAAGTPAGDAATAVPAAAPVPPPATLATPVGASSTALSEIGDAFGTGPRTVRLSFDRESWVEIRDARGRLIFSQLNPPGSSQEVQGEPPLSLVVGNARSVRLAYGGRDIDLAPHTRVDVARFTLD
ncbi:MAG: helix-turn-helix domain-containing protein [Betaproteobacteria bacterium]|nr:helix-turn-helix domain-containing protein [Betaproteobacteria bacterium]